MLLKMLQQTLSVLFLVSFFMFSGFSVSTASSNIYIQCSQLNFTSMTPYESNVNSLFSSLLDSASVYNFNKFETSPPSDSVYGLFQCRGDLSSPNCKDCVASAISQLKTSCPLATCGQIQLEGCFVKYADTSFFGADDKAEASKKCGPSIGYNSDVLNRIDDALANLVGGNEQYFRGGDFGSIRGVAQCVQDLSLSDCHDCLLEASGRLRSECVTSILGDMYLGKCYIRYAEQGNENQVSNGNSTPSGGGSNNDIAKWIGYILAAAFGAGGLSLAATNFCNVNKTTNNIKIAKEALETAIEAKKTATVAAEEASETAKEARKKEEEKKKKKEEKKKAEQQYMQPPFGYYPYQYPYYPCM